MTPMRATRIALLGLALLAGRADPATARQDDAGDPPALVERGRIEPLAVGAAYVAAVPPWEAPDEPWHLAYAEALAAGRWPTTAETYEAHQPPLYYLGLAALLRALPEPALPRSPASPFFPLASAALLHPPADPAAAPLAALRTLSGLLTALVVALTWATAFIAGW